MNDVIPTITLHNIYFSIGQLFDLMQIKKISYIHWYKIHILISNNSNQDSLGTLFET